MGYSLLGYAQNPFVARRRLVGARSDLYVARMLFCLSLHGRYGKLDLSRKWAEVAVEAAQVGDGPIRVSMSFHNSYPDGMPTTRYFWLFTSG